MNTDTIAVQRKQFRISDVVLLKPQACAVLRDNMWQANCTQTYVFYAVFEFQSGIYLRRARNTEIPVVGMQTVAVHPLAFFR